MKLRYLLASTWLLPMSAYAADAARPAAPAPSFGMVLEGSVGATSVGIATDNANDVENTRLTDFAGSLRIAFPVASGMSIQFDVVGEKTNNNGGFDNFDNSLIGAVHLSRRSDSGLIGLFGGAGYGTAEDKRTNAWFIGVEGQSYFGNWTVQGQAGYFDADNHAYSFYQAGFVRGLARYFLGANSSIQFEASILGGSQDNVSATVQTGVAAGWGVRFDQQLAMMPGTATSLFLAYRGGTFQALDDSGDNGIFTDHTLMGGLRLGFGSAGTDLRTNDRRGVNLDLPDFGRWAGAGPIVD